MGTEASSPKRRSNKGPGFLGAVFFVLACTGSALAPEAQAEGPPPTRAEAVALVEKFAKAWETGDTEAFLSTLDSKMIWAHPGGVLDKKGAGEFFEKWKTEWKNTRIYPTLFVVEGNHLLAEYQFCATNIETGKREAEGTAAVGEIENGKLISWKEYYDHSVGALQAEGKLPVDEGAPSFPYPRSAPNRW